MPVVLISGASSGIGRATALRLARAGWTVLAGVRAAPAGEELAAEARGASGTVQPLELDITNAAQVAAVAELLEREHGGRLDALVNNAGIGVGGPLELISSEEMRQQFEVNVFAQVALTQTLLPALRSARGRIVLISSIGGRVTLAFTAPYAASKHALEAIGDALRVELHRSHVQVTLIEPGSVATPIWGKSLEQAASVEIPPRLQQLYGDVPAALGKALEETARRGIPPEQVAATIERALSARRMRARYLVGRDARVMLTLRTVLPAPMFDAFVRRALHLR
jgi:NAD(P)-dependent dehydrogenase (short-subunit alcohol dehydrogenase family)